MHVLDRLIFHQIFWNFHILRSKTQPFISWNHFCYSCFQISTPLNIWKLSTFFNNRVFDVKLLNSGTWRITVEAFCLPSVMAFIASSRGESDWRNCTTLSLRDIGKLCSARNIVYLFGLRFVLDFHQIFAWWQAFWSIPTFEAKYQVSLWILGLICWENVQNLWGIIW